MGVYMFVPASVMPPPPCLLQCGRVQTEEDSTHGDGTAEAQGKRPRIRGGDSIKAYLSVCLSTCLSVYLSVDLPVYLLQSTKFWVIQW